MNYFIIEDIDNPLDTFCIIETPMSRSALNEYIDEAKEKAEENGNYVMDELEVLLEDDFGTSIIWDFDTLYV